MIDKIHFLAAPIQGEQPLSIRTTALTVLVGPNNSGKSQALRDIENILINQSNISKLVIADLDMLEFASYSEYEKCFLSVADNKGDKANAPLRFRSSLGHHNALEINPAALKDYHGDAFLRRLHCGIVFGLRLDGKARLSLMTSKSAGDLLGPPDNHLGTLFQDRQARSQLCQLTFEAFDRYLVIDPTSPGTLRVRLSKRAPVDEAEEQGWDSRSRDFHRQANLISEFSDGVNAYVGILGAILGSHSRIILIDEPEAFLHPALSRKLGYYLSTIACERSASVIVATHSSDFLMGCVESGIPVQVVRLTYGKNVATARCLAADDLQDLMRDPLLRSANVLAGLFHEGVIVGESDADRAFYQEINHRLLTQSEGGGRGILFLNAQNKQTVRRIIGPLRKLGVPAAAIVDIDVLKDGGNEWTSLLESAQMPKSMHPALSIQRITLMGLFEEIDKTGKKMKREGGIRLLRTADQATCRHLFEQLAQYGIFILPEGELESWLRPLGATGHGPTWLVDIFARMKSAPEQDGYVSPSDSDVWEFMRSIAMWIRDPARLGTGT